MPTPRIERARSRFPSSRLRHLLKLLSPGLAAVSLGAALLCASCKRTSPLTETISPKAEEPASDAKSSPDSKGSDEKKLARLEGDAFWYDVPSDSLARRRAGKSEFTAAHNRLPLGTMVRVTHLANGKSVVVRITDRGITNRHALIDLCKEAAEKLGMLREGSARVRLEILPDDKGADAGPDSRANAAHP